MSVEWGDRAAQAGRGSSGQALGGLFIGLWRYRVGDYRLLCAIEDGRLVVLVVGVGHRGAVYR